MRSITQHQFAVVPAAKIPRSVFNRSHGHKTAFNSGYLVPFFVDEALPGDTFKLQTTIFARLTTPIVPIMDNLYLETFYFAVPNRILWEHWVNMCGEQGILAADTSNYTPDTFTVPKVISHADGFPLHSVADYFGIPIYNQVSVNALPFRAYNKIFEDWFRDQNLVASPQLNFTDLDDTENAGSNLYYPLRKRGKRHDYFTSCLPWPQKGPAVMLPLGTTAPVYGDGKALGLTMQTNPAGVNFGMLNTTDGSSADAKFSRDVYGKAVGTAVTYPGAAMDNTKAIGVSVKGTTSGLYADLEGATAATINSLRQAFQLQRMFERDARGGTRYQELVKAHFGVTGGDSRLQRSEFLGSSSQRMSINPVQQTSATGATGTPLGNLAAYAQVTDSKGGFSKSFTEHSTIIGLVNVRADLTYQKGLDRMWSRQTRYDYYWPALAMLGEQEVLNKELWYIENDTDNDAVFGYQERYAEYRYKPSKITGVLNSHASNTLDVWHLAQKFIARPTLSQTFIEEAPPLQRVLAVSDPQPEIIMDVFFDLKCARPMPVFGVPGMIDHF